VVGAGGWSVRGLGDFLTAGPSADLTGGPALVVVVVVVVAGVGWGVVGWLLGGAASVRGALAFAWTFFGSTPSGLMITHGQPSG
jgi:hypothetical protein